MAVIRGDARAIPLADRSVDAVVTSPPYLGQRGYGDHPAEGGEEETVADYVAWLADVFDELRRVLKPDGLAWLNIGDKANGSGGGGGDWSPNGSSRSKGKRWGLDRGPKSFRDPAYPRQTMLDVPGAVVRELLDRGWRLRLPIVWDKAVEERASLKHLNRPRWAHEMIFLLAPGPARPRFYPSMLEETGSVWHFGIRRPGRPKTGAPHLAPFPDELARRCILPSTLPGDLVLDPFDGSGTTRRVAETLGRRGVGLDLYAGETELESLEGKGRKPSDPVGKGEPRRTIDLEDLRALGLKPAVLYYASRLLREGRELPDVARELKLTPEQTAYIDEKTRPEEAAS